MATTEELVAAVKQYAKDHYTEGWDVVHETYSDTELEGVLIGAEKPVTTQTEAIAELQKVVDIWKERIGATSSGWEEKPCQKCGARVRRTLEQWDLTDGVALCDERDLCETRQMTEIVIVDQDTAQEFMDVVQKRTERMVTDEDREAQAAYDDENPPMHQSC
jgi:hypothetical protein